MTHPPMKTPSWRSVLRLPRFPPPKKRVAVVVPLSTQPQFSEADRTSLRHLYHFLGGYDIFFIAPPGTSPDLPDDATLIRFPAKYFGSAFAHSVLQLSPVLYEQFIDYQYILMYHLDALVFSDQLEAWCDKGLDFIGAPWFQTEHTPWASTPQVGNSGFALMNVRSFLRVLYSRRRTSSLKDELASSKRKGAPGMASMPLRLWALRRLLPLKNDVCSHIDYLVSKKQLSDLFWSREAKHYYPDFKVATVEEALLFAFEADPAGCFEKTDHRLPFGCHAWEKFDPAFWEPYLLRDERQMSGPNTPHGPHQPAGRKDAEASKSRLPHPITDHAPE